jgi:hypothetical protein
MLVKLRHNKKFWEFKEKDSDFIWYNKKDFAYYLLQPGIYYETRENIYRVQIYDWRIEVQRLYFQDSSCYWLNHYTHIEKIIWDNGIFIGNNE